MAQGIQDEAVFVHEDDVAVLAGELQDQLLGDDLPFRPDQIHIQGQDPIQAPLGYLGDPAFFQMLPEQHAETGRQIRPFRQGIRQGDQGGVPVHIHQQIDRPVLLVHLQQQRSPAGHENLENLSAAESGCQFPGQELQGDSF